MSYIPPAVPCSVTWEGSSGYDAPPLPLNVTWQDGGASAVIRVTGPRGRITMLVAVAAPAVVSARIAVGGPRGRISARANLVVQSRTSVVGPRGLITAHGVVVVRGTARVGGPRGRLAAECSVVRYELRGIVRNQGVLVERRVRAYERMTGAFAGEADTVAGAFSIHVGFDPGEYVVLPIDLSESATDYAPPAANRVLSLLARDIP